MSNDKKIIHPGSPYSRNEYSTDSNFSSFCENWELYKDRFAIFLGAGASYGATNNKGEKLLGAFGLRNAIWSKFMLTEKERIEYDFKNLASMSLEHASAIAETKTDRGSINKFIKEKYTADKTLWQHATLPFLDPKAIFTTNYDNLIELGYNLQSGKNEINKISPVFDDNYEENEFIPLYKPHGSVDKSSSSIKKGGIVITQFDYFDVHNDRLNMLEKFVDLLSNKCVLFIGYSFMDFDISRLIYNLHKAKNRPRWYAVFPRNDSDVKTMYLEKYGIKQINRTFFDFMLDLDNKINFIPTEWKFDAMDSNPDKYRLQGYS